MKIEIEYDQWLRVKGPMTKEDALRFFGMPPGWPVYFDGFDTERPMRRWRVLSDAWVRQQQEKRNG